MSLAFIHPQILWLLLLIPLTIGIALLGPRRPTRGRFLGGLILRVFLLCLVILALAGIQARIPSDFLTVVFVLDVSDSIGVEEQARGEAIIKEAVQNMPAGDKAAIVVFGEDALVEQLASETRSIPDIASIPITSRTDIASALQLALALFPDEGAKRLVLLSDGRQNLGKAIDQAELAGAYGVEVTYLPLGNIIGETEILLESLEAPASVRQGQSFDLLAEVQSTTSVNAELRVFADGKLIQTLNVTLENGSNHFSIPIETSETGFLRFLAQIIPDQDTLLQNNQASAFTMVHGPPRVLIVEGPRNEAQANTRPAASFAEALGIANMQATILPAREMPTSLTALADFEAVILVDVPSSAMPVESMEVLQVYVRDLGHGLLMTGGEQSFGAGGYLRTPVEEALPVYMDVRNKEQQANIALVLAVDKSGSMGRCHCDDPDLNQTYTRQESGQPKVDIAKEAIMRAAGALGDLDYLGVIAFDEAAKWALKTQKLVDLNSLESAIGGIPAQGQTNLQSGVEAAYESLLQVDAQRKHIILLTDGWVHQTALLSKAGEMQDDGITLSVVAAGGGSARYLEELAQSGGGTYYPAVDILQVPDFFLKETVNAVGRYIIEEPFYPLPGMESPIMTHLDPAVLPPLYGYNGTTPKGTARLDLITPQGDPLLATWQYGLGRSAAWTSDVETRWATQWLTWNEFPRFAAQLVSWILPAPQMDGLTASTYVEQNRGVIELEAQNQTGQPLNFLYAHAAIIGPDLSVTASELSQIGPGRYQTEVELSEPGTYLVRLGVNDGDTSLGQMVLGLVIPYSPEYLSAGLNTTLLSELARITGGGKLAEPMAAFIHNLEPSARAREIWQPLLLIVAVLFPLDVAIRRVILGSSDYQKATNWVLARLPWRKMNGSQVEKIDPKTEGLFAARDRARQRQDRVSHSPQTKTEREKDNSLPLIVTDSQPNKSNTETLSRLREAKKRIHRKE